MAPIAPTKRTTARQKARARSKAESSSLPLPLPHPRPNPSLGDNKNNNRNASSSADPDSGFLDSRHDRQLIRRNTFVARVAKSSDKPGHRSLYGGLSKRRRPSKKLVATLDSLGDALDDIVVGGSSGGGGGGGANAEEMAGAATATVTAKATAAATAMMMMKAQAPELEGRIRHRSLRSRPGALRRKERVVRAEMDLFGRSLARLAAGAGGGDDVDGGRDGPPPLAALPRPFRPPTAAGSAALAVSTLATPVPGVGAGVVGAGGAGSISRSSSSSAAAPAAAPSAAPSSRFAALRGYIAATMEQSPAFRGKS